MLANKAPCNGRTLDLYKERFGFQAVTYSVTLSILTLRSQMSVDKQIYSENHHHHKNFAKKIT